MDDSKFKKDQEVVVKDFMINGSRMDIHATVTRNIYDRERKVWRVEVYLNDTYVILDQNRLVDAKVFWGKR
jgi:hypothetical protein